MQENALTLRVIGYVSSLILTMTAFFIIIKPDFFGLTTIPAVLSILALAFAQSAIQVIFFIDVWSEGGKWNFGVFLSTISIIFVVVAFSIWIMDHLNYNMMPKA